MKQNIKKLIPPSLFESLLFKYYQIKFGHDLKNNLKLKNKYQGQRCFVIGNGPSLKKMDLRPLRNEQVFVVNHFYEHPQARIIRPNFYSLVERLQTDPTRHFNQQFLKNTLENILKLANQIDDINFFFHISHKRIIEGDPRFKKFDVYYLTQLLPILESIHLHDDLTQPISFLDASILSTFCSCAYLGFTEIYFVGCDLDFYSNRGVHHFYNDKRGFGKVELQKSSNEQLFYVSYLTFKQWRVTVEHFERQGVKVFNAGVGGDNDTCPRVNYKKIIAKTKN